MKAFGKEKLALRVISAALVLCFVFQDVGWAMPEIKSPDSKAWARKLLPSIPHSVATIEDAWKGGDKTVILIEDAHANASGQLNLAKALDLILSSQALRNDPALKNEIASAQKDAPRNDGFSVFVEGGFGDDSLSHMRSLAPPEQRKRIARNYLQNGFLHGEEYLDIISGHAFKIVGAESKDQYLDALELYRFVASRRDRFNIYLNRIESCVKFLKTRILNPSLEVFLNAQQQFQNEEISFVDYAQILSEFPSVNHYPNLLRLRRFKKVEKALEKQRVSKRHRMAILERQMRQASKMDYGALLKELDACESDILSRLTQTAEEKMLERSARTARYYRRLIDFHLTPEEFARFNREPMTARQLGGFLNFQLMRLEDRHEDAMLVNEEFELLVAKADAFYGATLKRDQTMVERVADDPAQTSVLIAGGYHTPNLKSLLKSKNISWIVVRPQVRHETNQKRYEQILLNQQIQAPALAMTRPSTIRRAALADTPIAAARLSQDLSFSRPPDGLGAPRLRRSRDKFLLEPFSKRKLLAIGLSAIVLEAATVGARSYLRLRGVDWPMLGWLPDYLFIFAIMPVQMGLIPQTHLTKRGWKSLRFTQFGLAALATVWELGSYWVPPAVAKKLGTGFVFDWCDIPAYWAGAATSYFLITHYFKPVDKSSDAGARLVADRLNEQLPPGSALGAVFKRILLATLAAIVVGFITPNVFKKPALPGVYRMKAVPGEFLVGSTITTLEFDMAMKSVKDWMALYKNLAVVDGHVRVVGMDSRQYHAEYERLEDQFVDTMARACASIPGFGKMSNEERMTHYKIFFNKNGYFFNSHSALVDGFKIREFDIYPVVSVEEKSFPIHTNDGKVENISFNEYTLGSPVLTDADAVKQFIPYHSGEAAYVANGHAEVLSFPSLRRTISKTAVKRYRRYIAIFPKLGEGKTLSPQECDVLRSRISFNSYYPYCYKLGIRPEMTDDEIGRRLLEAKFEFTHAHEALHIFDGRSGKWFDDNFGPFRQFSELRAMVHSVLATRKANDFLSELYIGTREFHGNPSGHDEHPMWYLMKRLGYYFYHNKTLHRKYGLKLGYTDRPVRQFTDLEPWAQNQIFEGMAQLSNEESLLLFQKVWAEIQSPDNPFFQGLENGVAVTQPVLDSQFHWRYFSASLVVGLLVLSGVAYLAAHNKKKSNSGARLADASWSGLDPGKTVWQDPHFIEAVEYFNRYVLKGTMTWHLAMDLFEIFRNDRANPYFSPKIRELRLQSFKRMPDDVRRVFSRLNESLNREQVVEIVLMITDLVARQFLIGYSGFNEVPTWVYPSESFLAADGHHRLAFFLAHYAILRNGLAPQYGLFTPHETGGARLAAKKSRTEELVMKNPLEEGESWHGYHYSLDMNVLEMALHELNRVLPGGLKGKRFLDFGAADLRVALMATESYGVKAVAVEINPELHRRYTQPNYEEAHKIGLAKNLRLLPPQSALNMDWSKTDVVFFYYTEPHDEVAAATFRNDLQAKLRRYPNVYLAVVNDSPQYGLTLDAQSFDLLTEKEISLERLEKLCVYRAKTATSAARLARNNKHAKAPTGRIFDGTLPLKIERVFRKAGVARKKIAFTGVGVYAPSTITEPVFESMLKFLRIPENKTYQFLDLGSGQGEFALRLANRYPELIVTGIEYDELLYEESKRLVQAAEELGYIRPGHVRLIRGDFNDPQLSPSFESSDLIYYFSAGTYEPHKLALTLSKHWKAKTRLIEVGLNTLEELLRRESVTFRQVSPQGSPELYREYERVESAARLAGELRAPDDRLFRLHTLSSSELRAQLLKGFRSSDFQVRARYSEREKDPSLKKMDVAGTVILRKIRNRWCFLMGRRTNHGDKPGVFTFPAGKVDPWEHSDQAALRETREETGIRISRKDVVGQLHQFSGQHEGILVDYLVLVNDSKRERVKPTKELNPIVWIPADEIMAAQPGGAEKAVIDYIYRRYGISGSPVMDGVGSHGLEHLREILLRAESAQNLKSHRVGARLVTEQPEESSALSLKYSSFKPSTLEALGSVQQLQDENLFLAAYPLLTMPGGEGFVERVKSRVYEPLRQIFIKNGLNISDYLILYDDEAFHSTVANLIPGGVQLDDEVVRSGIKKIDNTGILDQAQPYRISFDGVYLGGPNAIAAGTVDNNSLTEVRNGLTRDAGLKRMDAVHATLFRFKKAPPKNVYDEILTLMAGLKNEPLGKVSVERISLIAQHGSTMGSNQIKNFKTYPLVGARLATRRPDKREIDYSNIPGFDPEPHIPVELKVLPKSPRDRQTEHFVKINGFYYVPLAVRQAIRNHRGKVLDGSGEDASTSQMADLASKLMRALLGRSSRGLHPNAHRYEAFEAKALHQYFKIPKKAVREGRVIYLSDSSFELILSSDEPQKLADKNPVIATLRASHALLSEKALKKPNERWIVFDASGSSGVVPATLAMLPNVAQVHVIQPDRQKMLGVKRALDANDVTVKLTDFSRVWIPSDEKVMLHDSTVEKVLALAAKTKLVGKYPGHRYLIICGDDDNDSDEFFKAAGALQASIASSAGKEPGATWMIRHAWKKKNGQEAEHHYSSESVQAYLAQIKGFTESAEAASLWRAVGWLDSDDYKNNAVVRAYLLQVSPSEDLAGAAAARLSVEAFSSVLGYAPFAILILASLVLPRAYSAYQLRRSVTPIFEELWRSRVKCALIASGSASDPIDLSALNRFSSRLEESRRLTLKVGWILLADTPSLPEAALSKLERVLRDIPLVTEYQDIEIRANQTGSNNVREIKRIKIAYPDPLQLRNHLDELELLSAARLADSPQLIWPMQRWFSPDEWILASRYSNLTDDTHTTATLFNQNAHQIRELVSPSGVRAVSKFVVPEKAGRAFELFAGENHERVFSAIGQLCRLDEAGYWGPAGIVPGVWKNNMLVMPLLQGANFYSYFGTMSGDERLRFGLGRDYLKIAYRIARLAAFFNALGFVHRDLKPGNFWRHHDGGVALFDFDLSLPHGVSGVFGDGEVAGTFGFASRHQLEGKPASFEHDAFSLAMMLIWLWSGENFPANLKADELAEILSNNPLKDIILSAASLGMWSGEVILDAGTLRYEDSFEMARAIWRVLRNKSQRPMNFSSRTGARLSINATKLYERAGVEREKGLELKDKGVFGRTHPRMLYKAVDAMDVSLFQAPRILELGSGQGENLVRLAKRFPYSTIVGIEYDEKLFSDSQKIIDAASLEGILDPSKVSVLQGDFNAARFKNEFQLADVVYYYAYGTYDRKALASTLDRWVRPETKIVIAGMDDTLIPQLQGRGFELKQTYSDPVFSVWRMQRSTIVYRNRFLRRVSDAFQVLLTWKIFTPIGSSLISFVNRPKGARLAEGSNPQMRAAFLKAVIAPAIRSRKTRLLAKFGRGGFRGAQIKIMSMDPKGVIEKDLLSLEPEDIARAYRALVEGLSEGQRVKRLVAVDGQVRRLVYRLGDEPGAYGRDLRIEFEGVFAPEVSMILRRILGDYLSGLNSILLGDAGDPEKAFWQLREKILRKYHAVFRQEPELEEFVGSAHEMAFKLRTQNKTSVRLALSEMLYELRLLFNDLPSEGRYVLTGSGQMIQIMEPDKFDAFSAVTIASKIADLQSEHERPVNVVFATGNTMKGMLIYLSAMPGIDWKRIHAYHLDEYAGLDPDHPSSFAFYLNKYLFSRVPIPRENVHFVDGSKWNQPSHLKAYMDDLRSRGGADIGILGVGVDGHLAFNEPPGFSAFDTRMQLVDLNELTLAQNEPDYPAIRSNPRAMTMGMADIADFKNIFFMANKATKARIVKKGLQGPLTENVPLSMLQALDSVVFLLDTDAASGLDFTDLSGARLAASSAADVPEWTEPLTHHSEIYELAKKRYEQTKKKILIINMDSHSDYELGPRYVRGRAPHIGNWGKAIVENGIGYHIWLRSYREYSRQFERIETNWDTQEGREAFAKKYEESDEAAEVWLTIDYDYFSLSDEPFDEEGQKIRGKKVGIFHMDDSEIVHELERMRDFLSQQGVPIDRIVPCISKHFLNVPEADADAFIERVTGYIQEVFGARLTAASSYTFSTSYVPLSWSLANQLRNAGPPFSLPEFIVKAGAFYGFLENALGRLSMGEIHRDGLEKRFEPKQDEIFRQIGLMQNYLQTEYIRLDQFENYCGLQRGTPDSGMCLVVSAIFFAALRKSGLHPQQGLIRGFDGLVKHAYIYLPFGLEGIVVDAAIGQFIPAFSRRVALMGVEEYVRLMSIGIPIADQIFDERYNEISSRFDKDAQALKVAPGARLASPIHFFEDPYPRPINHVITLPKDRSIYFTVDYRDNLHPREHRVMVRHLDPANPMGEWKDFEAVVETAWPRSDTSSARYRYRFPSSDHPIREFTIRVDDNWYPGSNLGLDVSCNVLRELRAAIYGDMPKRQKAAQAIVEYYRYHPERFGDDFVVMLIREAQNIFSPGVMTRYQQLLLRWIGKRFYDSEEHLLDLIRKFAILGAPSVFEPRLISRFLSETRSSGQGHLWQLEFMRVILSVARRHSRRTDPASPLGRAIEKLFAGESLKREIFSMAEMLEKGDKDVEAVRHVKQKIKELYSPAGARLARLPDAPISRATSGFTYSGRLNIFFSNLMMRMRRLNQSRGVVQNRPFKIVYFGIGEDGAPTLFDLIEQLPSDWGLIELYAVDNVERYLRKAEARANSAALPQHVNLFFRKGDFESGPGVQGADLIICANVMQHYYGDELLRAREALQSALSDTGIFVAAEGSKSSIKVSYFNRFGRVTQLSAARLAARNEIPAPLRDLLDSLGARVGVQSDSLELSEQGREFFWDLLKSRTGNISDGDILGYKSMNKYLTGRAYLLNAEADSDFKGLPVGVLVETRVGPLFLDFVEVYQNAERSQERWAEEHQRLNARANREAGSRNIRGSLMDLRFARRSVKGLEIFDIIFTESSSSESAVFSPNTKHSEDWQGVLSGKLDKLKGVNVGVVGAGSGVDVLMAIRAGAASVSATEIMRSFEFLTRFNVNHFAEQNPTFNMPQVSTELKYGLPSNSAQLQVILFNTPAVVSNFGSGLRQGLSNLPKKLAVNMKASMWISFFDELNHFLVSNPGALAILRVQIHVNSGLIDGLSEQDSHQARAEAFLGRYPNLQATFLEQDFFELSAKPVDPSGLTAARLASGQTVSMAGIDSNHLNFVLFFLNHVFGQARIAKDRSVYSPLPFEAIVGIFNELQNRYGFLQDKTLLDFGAGADARVSLVASNIFKMKAVAVEKDEQIADEAREILAQAKVAGFGERIAFFNADALEAISKNDDFIVFYYTQPEPPGDFRRKLEDSFIQKASDHAILAIALTEGQIERGFGDFERLVRIDRSPIRPAPAQSPNLFLRLYKKPVLSQPESPFLAARLADAPQEKESAGLIEKLYDDRQFAADEVVIFVAKVKEATKVASAKIMIGGLALEYEERADGRLMIRGLPGGEKFLSREQWKKNSSGKELEMRFSMSEFKAVFDLLLSSSRGVTMPKEKNGQAVLAVIDLEAFDPNLKGYKEIVLPMLLREIRWAAHQPWGKTAHFQLKGKPSAVVEAYKELVKYDAQYPGETWIQRVYVDEKSLPNAPMRKVLLSTPLRPARDGQVHAYHSLLQEGDIPNFRALLMIGVAMGRCEKLSTGSSEFEQIKAMFLALAGVSVQSAADLTNPALSTRKAIPSIARLPFQQAIQAARLARKMLDASA